MTIVPYGNESICIRVLRESLRTEILRTLSRQGWSSRLVTHISLVIGKHSPVAFSAAEMWKRVFRILLQGCFNNCLILYAFRTNSANYLVLTRKNYEDAFSLILYRLRANLCIHGESRSMCHEYEWQSRIYIFSRNKLVVFFYPGVAS